MKKILDPSAHGMLDYAVVGLFLAAPSIMKFSRRSALASYGLGLAQLGLSLSTRYPLGILKKVPFKIHGYIEAATALQMLGLPLLLKLNKVCEVSFFAVSGATLALVVALTDYSEAAVEKAQAELDQELTMLTATMTYEDLDELAIGPHDLQQAEYRRAS